MMVRHDLEVEAAKASIDLATLDCTPANQRKADRGASELRHRPFDEVEEPLARLLVVAACRRRTARTRSCGCATNTSIASMRVIVRLPLSPSSALMNFDEPWVVTADDAADIARAVGRILRRSGGQLPRHAGDPDPVDPALQHRGLPAPPRRVDEHECFRPARDRRRSAAARRRRPGALWVRRSSADIAGSNPSAYRSVEPDVVRGCAVRQRPVAGRRHQRAGVGVAVHDQDAHPDRRQPLLDPGEEGVSSRRSSACPSRTARAMRRAPANRTTSGGPG